MMNNSRQVLEGLSMVDFQAVDSVDLRDSMINSGKEVLEEQAPLVICSKNSRSFSLEGKHEAVLVKLPSKLLKAKMLW